MKTASLPLLGGLFLPAVAWAVYAPIPEQEQGKALTATVDASVYHDSNIFGSATNAIDSWVYSLAPKLEFNASVDPQTFASASYQISFDDFENRPTDKLLISHDLSLRVAHKFTDVTNVDLTEAFQIEHNPQSLLQGVPLNADQSFKRNEFDGRLATGLGQKTSLVVKYRNVYFNYDDPGLSRDLDRMEHLGGLELNDKFLPDTTLVGEYRYQAIDYYHTGSFKDKKSNFFLGGVDYVVGKQLTLSGRAGVESRERQGSSNTTAPSVELTGQYNYTENSFVTAGYTYSLEETDNPTAFNDTKMNRVFVNVQQALTAMVVASGSLTVEPSVLQGRGTQANVNETATRFGLALTYVARKNLTFSATFDYDKVNSDEADRRQDRTRFGLNGRLYF